MHRLQTGHRLEPHLGIAHGEIRRLHECEAHRPGEVRVLGMGPHRRPRRHHHDPGLFDVGGSERAERGAARIEPVLDRQHARLVQRLGVDAGHHLAVLHRMTDARRHLGAVRRDRDRPGGRSGDVRGVEDEPVRPRRRDAHTPAEVLPMRQDRLRGEVPAGQEPLGPEEVVEHQFQDLGALFERPTEPRPVLGVDDERHRVELSARLQPRPGVVGMGDRREAVVVERGVAEVRPVALVVERPPNLGGAVPERFPPPCLRRHGRGPSACGHTTTRPEGWSVRVVSGVKKVEESDVWSAPMPSCTWSTHSRRAAASTV